MAPWTRATLRESPGILDAEAELRRMLDAAGKTRFGLVRDHEPYCVPVQGGYLVSLDLDMPQCGSIYFHELQHGILLEQGYPIAISVDGTHGLSGKEEGGLLESITNSIHHSEIFRRMGIAGTNVEEYFQMHAATITRKMRPVLNTSSSWHINHPKNVLAVLDGWLMGKFGEGLLNEFRSRGGEEVVRTAEEAVARMRAIGTETPEKAQKAGLALLEVLAKHGRHGEYGDYQSFWKSIRLVTIKERNDLPPCPEIAGTLDNLSPSLAPVEAPAGIAHEEELTEGRRKAMWKHLRAILLLPFMVTVVAPGIIFWLTEPDTLGLWQSVHATRVALPIFGSALICLGLVLMVATIRLFGTVGKGTLAPWNPPQRLVVRGVYRHVRNPMISGVFFVLLGETALAASLPLLGWFVVFVVINAAYIPLAEEPGLVKRFGDDYLTYKQNVPRWIPRLRPWTPDEEVRPP